MHPLFIVLIAAAALSALCLFIFAPGVGGKDGKKSFYGRNIAHRGLYERDQSVPENSLPAFSRAAERGYGVELDVQLSKDGRVVVFHDDTLLRVCGVDRRVDELTYGQLCGLSLFGTGERIPLFTEVLSVLSGRVPVVVELKNGKRNAELCEKTLAFLKGYEGEYCVESFSPFIVGWFRKHAPHIMRGQLAQLPADYGDAVSKPAALLLGVCFFNFIARPHFIAHRFGKATLPVKLARRLGAMSFTWTPHDESEEKNSDAVIFEYYLPAVKFK